MEIEHRGDHARCKPCDTILSDMVYWLADYGLDEAYDAGMCLGGIDTTDFTADQIVVKYAIAAGYNDCMIDRNKKTLLETWHLAHDLLENLRYYCAIERDNPTIEVSMHG